MKKLFMIFAVLLSTFTLSAYAEGFFVGGDLGIVVYPNWVDRINSNLISNGASYSYSEQKKSSIGVGIRVGQWVTDNFGWEIGYDNLGSVSGNTTATNGFISGTGTWKYSATSTHAAVLGGIKFGRNTMYGKIGVHSDSTTLDGTFVVGGGSYSKSASGTGLLIGGGYIFQFNEHLSGKVGLEIFNGVNFTDWTVFTNPPTKENLVKVAYGLDYTF